MAVAFGHATEAQQAATITSKTWAHDCTGDNYLTVFVTHRNDPGTVTATYNGVSMTLTKSQSATYNWEEFFVLANPTTGSNNIVVSWTNGTNVGAVGMSFSGVGSIGTAVSGTFAGAGNVTSTGITTTANDMIVGGIGLPGSGASLSVVTGTERIENGATTDASTNGATNTGVGSTSITWGQSSADPGTWIAVDLIGSVASNSNFFLVL